MAAAATATARTNAEALRAMGGLEKSALLLLSLGEQTIARLFERMYDDEIRELSQAMANLGVIPSDIVEQLLVHFVQQFSMTGALAGTFESTERLLAKVMPRDRVNNIMEDVRGPAGRTMWDKLGNVNEVVLANYLKNEYPQTVAVVLSKVKPEHAARVLAQLPDSFTMEVVLRMLRMESVQKDVLDDVERTLRKEFMSNLARTNRRDAYEAMAEIFNNFDRATEARFLSALEERSREAADKVKALMFTFEDLARLEASSVQTLLRNIDKAKLGLCLKGASDTVKELFFSNMSERAGKILKEDMESMGPVRLRDVEEAQMQMVQKAKELANKGEIMLTDQKGDDELVY